MIVEMKIQNFFDDDLDSWVVGNCEEPMVFHAESFLDMVAGVNAILRDESLVVGNIEFIKINSVTLEELNGFNPHPNV